MNKSLLKFYHQLPPSARDIVASIRGYYLRSWRYGPETEHWATEAHEREYWSTEKWKAYREKRLASVLHRAATQVPYYRDQWAERRRQGDKASWDYLENWPILEKNVLRADALRFLADDCNPKKMFHEHTSGTTGKSLDLWWSWETVKRWYALFEARWRNWYGVSRHDRWAIIGGQLITPIEQRHPPFWVWNSAFHQLYMSSYHLAPDLIPAYLDALARYKIKYLFGYTSSLYSLAQGALNIGRDDLQFAVAITNAEPVFDYQRQMIQKAFHTPVRETYGMSEIVIAAGECEAEQMHLWPEVGWVEVLEDNQPVAAGMVGDLVCTGLFNLDMPLIRYRLGDRAALSSDESSCDCGRTLPRLKVVEGRTDDLLYTSDGRRIGRLDPIFKQNLPVLEAQIVQEKLDYIRVLYVPSADYTSEAGQSIVKGIQDRMGAVQVILEAVDKVPRTSNGKFRAVICNLSAEERQQFM
ncbi:MAG: phenylacetate--CoA ligase family protein [Pseudomonadales bacterium]|nr:phenylacetate--CoA ligase family protein [Pseudomonadales bacterium]